MINVVDDVVLSGDGEGDRDRGLFDPLLWLEELLGLLGDSGWLGFVSTGVVRGGTPR